VSACSQCSVCSACTNLVVPCLAVATPVGTGTQPCAYCKGADPHGHWHTNPDKVVGGRVCSTCYSAYTGHGCPRPPKGFNRPPRVAVAGVLGVAGAADAADDLVWVVVPAREGRRPCRLHTAVCQCPHVWPLPSMA